MENHHCSWENPLFRWPFSIAISSHYQMVAISHGSKPSAIGASIWIGPATTLVDSKDPTNTGCRVPLESIGIYLWLCLTMWLCIHLTICAHISHNLSMTMYPYVSIKLSAPKVIPQQYPVGIHWNQLWPQLVDHSTASTRRNKYTLW